MKLDIIVDKVFKGIFALLLVVALIGIFTWETATLVDVGISAAITGVIIALAGAIVLPIINSFDNPKVLLQSVAIFAIFGVLFAIVYSLANDEITASYISYNVTDPSESKMIGGALNMFYLLFVIALVGIVITEVNKALKS